MTAVRRRSAVRRDRSTAPSRKMRKANSARETCLSGDSDTVSVACIKRKQPYPRVARPSQVVQAVSSKKTDASLSDGKPQQERRSLQLLGGTKPLRTESILVFTRTTTRNVLSGQISPSVGSLRTLSQMCYPVGLHRHARKRLLNEVDYARRACFM